MTKLIEWQINEDDEQRGVTAISLVEHPAIESDWMTFSSEEKQLKFAAQDKERQIVMGAALIPKKQILRVDAEGNEYYGFFSSDTVRRGMELFMMDGNIKNSTFEHQEVVNGCVVVESWIVEDTEKDKSALFGFNVPKGTWMVSLKVNNQTIWEEFVKTGIVKGFSIEGYFTDGANKPKDESLSNIESISMKKKLFDSVIDKVKQAFTDEVKFAETALADGRKIVTPAEEFAIGVEVMVEIDGETAPLEDGEWELESGEILVVAAGVVEDIKKPVEEEMTEDEVHAELSAIIEGAVANATKGLNESIETLKAEVETLKTAKSDVETELASAKTELAKTPAQPLPRKEVATTVETKVSLPKGMDKSLEIFNKYKA